MKKKKLPKNRRTVHAVDLFCGAGGTSTGLYKAADELGFNVNLLAINHWKVAIETHSRNHKYAEHICETLDSVDPRKVIPRGKLDLLIASPECTHHSIARGGKPMSDQSRASAWHVLRWAEALRIENIMIENVKEFMSWGPLGVNGLPLKSKKGETFKAFINALEALSYKVEYKILNAADYGDPTTRKRLFILARLGRRGPSWPAQTHFKDGKGNKRWRAAKSIIDWSLPSESIATRKRPLAPNTMRRIAAGLAKFGGDPFFAMMYGTNKARSLDRPTPTVTSGGQHIGLCEPFIIPQFSKANPKSTKDPLGTITTTTRGMGLVQPFIVNMKGKSTASSINKPTPTQTTQQHQYLCEPYVMSAGGPKRSPRSVKDPLYTVLCRDSLAIVQPYLVEYYGKSKKNQKAGKGKERYRSVDEPLPTVTAGGNRFGVVEPFLVAHHGERPGQAPRVHSVKEPMPTVTPRGFELVEPHLICVNHGSGKGAGKPASRTRSLEDPMPTLTAKNGWGIIEPYIVEYYGTGKAKSLKNPLPTQTTKHKFGLVQAGMKEGRKGKVLEYYLDIRFRMLQPHELAAAMSFDKDYEFSGTKCDKVKQIGNAVAVKMSKRLCVAVLR